MGPPGAGKGTQAKFVAEQLRHPRDLDRRHLPRQRLAGHRARRRGQALHGRRRATSPTRSPTDGAQPHRRAGRRAGLPARRLSRAPSPQVEELDGMIPFTGTSLDAVVVPDRRPGGARRQRLLQRGRRPRAAPTTPRTSIRRRQEIYAEQTEPLIEVYRDRGLLVEVDGMGEVDEVTGADLRRARGRRRRAADGPSRWACATAASRSRRPSRSRRCASPGCVVGRDPRAAARRRSGPGSPPASSTRSPRTTSASTAATPSFQGYGHAVPGHASAPRSTTRSSTASPATGCSRDGDLISIDCGAIVDGWHGDAAITVAVGEVHRRRCSELMRVTEECDVARHRRGPPRRPGHRHLPRGRVPRAVRSPRRAATASSRTTPATASGRRCTSRPTCRTTVGRARAEARARAWRSRSSRWSTLGSQGHAPGRGRLDRRHRRRLAGRPTSSTRSR